MPLGPIGASVPWRRPSKLHLGIVLLAGVTLLNVSKENWLKSFMKALHELRKHLDEGVPVSLAAQERNICHFI